jgi:hypothetical protein
MLDESVDAEELAGMLLLRRAELEAQITADTSRLARVEARLRSIQEEGQMITQDVALKSVPSIRVAEPRGSAGSWAPEDIGPEIRSLFGRLGERLSAAGVEPCGQPIAYYEPRDDDTITVCTALPVDAEVGERDGFDVRDLPAVERVGGRAQRPASSTSAPTPSAPPTACWPSATASACAPWSATSRSSRREIWAVLSEELGVDPGRTHSA